MNNKSPLVTVLMPVYNGEKYLKEAIESVLNQSFTDYELLIINDGSTDNTSKILANYNDSRIRVIHKENSGVSRSLNKGLKLAKGKYIRRHDADDISEPYMLQMQLDFLKEHPEISLVSTQCAFMTENGKVSHNHRQPKKTFFKEDSSFKLIHFKDFFPYCPIVHGTVLGKKEIFEEFGGYRTEFLTAEDNDLWLRILDKYSIAVLNAVPYYLRLSSTSATVVHKSSTRHYRELALKFSEERRKIGSDSLMRGNQMPDVMYETAKQIHYPIGKHFREDILHFQYLVDIGAKDFKNISRDFYLVLKSGWRLKKTYKALLYPFLGNKLLGKLVKIKKMVK